MSNNEEEGIDIYNHLHEDNIELSVQSDYEYVQQQVTEEDDYSHVTTFNPNHILWSDQLKNRMNYSFFFSSEVN